MKYAELWCKTNFSFLEGASHGIARLMAGQVPVIGFFAIKWLPTEPRQAMLVLALQVGVALAAMFPVWWFQW